MGPRGKQTIVSHTVRAKDCVGVARRLGACLCRRRPSAKAATAFPCFRGTGICTERNPGQERGPELKMTVVSVAGFLAPRGLP